MNLLSYALHRLIQLIPLLIGLSLLTFVISRVLPGDPVGLAAGPQATEEIKEALRAEFGLDQPLHMQYITYMGNLFQGNWGESLYSRRAVLADLRTFFPATLELTLVAVILGAVLGVPAGVFSAYYQNRVPDHITRVIALFFVSFPAFWLAMIFQMALGRELGWFPIGKRFDVRIAAPAGMTGIFLIDSLIQLDFTAFRMALRHIATPALVLSFGSLASITRITRITMISLEFGWLMAGAVLVETIFDWPGLGLYIVESSLRLDFEPIMGITILYGIVFSLINIATDLVYGLIDPRIRYD